MTVFVDASFLIAIFNDKDQFHLPATKIAKQLESQNYQPYTSNVALAEAVNFIFRLSGSSQAKNFLMLTRKTDLEIIHLSKEIFSQGYKLLFKQKSKRGLNLFDCLHLATMKTLGIKTILTLDQGFKKEVKVIGLQ